MKSGKRSEIPALLTLVIAASFYAGIVALHRRFDRPLERPLVLDARDDVAEAWRVLWFDGVAGVDAAHAVIERRVTDRSVRRRLRAQLPSPSEPWYVEVRRLLEVDSLPSPTIPDGIEILEPGGKLIAGPFFILLRCATPGWATLRLGDSATPPVVKDEFDVAINKRTRSPAEITLERGKKYSLELRSKTDATIAGSSEIETLSEADESRLREDFELLKRHVSEPLLRRFAQLSLAMSHGLESEARSMLESLSSEVASDPPRGIEERRLFLARDDEVAHMRSAIHRRLKGR